MSGAEWPVTLSDVLLALGILLLLFEVIKGARPGAKYLTDHLLSLIVFGAAAAEFVLWPKFGTSTYFLLTLLALVDFLSGIALRRRRGAVAAPRAVRCAQARAERRAPQPSRDSSQRPRPRHAAPRRRPRSPNPCCWIIPSRRSRSPPSRRDAAVAGGPVAGTAAGQRRAAVAGHAAALTLSIRSDQMTCRVRRVTLRRSALCAIGGLRVRERARRRLRVCGAWSAVAIRWVTKVGSGRARRPLRRPVHRLGHRHQLDTGRLVGVDDLAVQDLF